MARKQLPVIGLGTFQDKQADVASIVYEAIKIGYKQIDTAYVYMVEDQVGKGIQKAIQDGLVKREDLFVVSKLPSYAHRRHRVIPYLKESLEKLQLDYVDLYLVHSPMHVEEEIGKLNSFAMTHPDPEADARDTWKGMEDAVEAGLTREIGLSNFNSQQIQTIYDSAKIKPTNLQVECHAYFQQTPLFEFCKKHNISFTAYAPLGSSFLPSFKADKFRVKKGQEDAILLEDPTLHKIGATHSKSEAQVCLRWLIQRGINVIPKTKNMARLKENFESQRNGTDRKTGQRSAIFHF